ncbi:uncharacterized protein (TIGR03083 family) [Nonomuraea polychroma]|uniref:Uncharacterized protein (TIGR03083 family) n=1 Tax=Nonomuraea polychroma TaxID=46176 RepID=A0A438MGZ3_9ACTN|nr:maleylpyruvate isomerase family mycothiol-dependent enzyme [Nonomuraea polychroma]RVX45129.1 uncharacterized protein (TIGR03083 family) [Nonomuraea polychroma]
MNEDEIFAAVTAERLSLAAFLDDVADDEWAKASLCPGWTVHDVLAHLTVVTHASRFDVFKGIVRARGDINRLIADQARRRAARFEPAELAGQLREAAASRRHAIATTVWEPLVDILVHGQDVARPLGRVREMPPDRAAPALTHVVRKTSFFGARERFAGLRLIATDADWSEGEGTEEVRGTAGELLLAATGRAAALQGLSGPGTALLSHRLQP